MIWVRASFPDKADVEKGNTLVQIPGDTWLKFTVIVPYDAKTLVTFVVVMAASFTGVPFETTVGTASM